MAQPDNKKFFENLTGAGKAIAVLTSGGDAQGNLTLQQKSSLTSHDRFPILYHFNSLLSVLFSIKMFRMFSTPYNYDI